MIKISIVGDIGSGKTYISKLFGAPFFSADTEVTKIYKKNRKCFNELKTKFPKFIKKFPVEKKELSDAIKKNISNLRKISSIVHPFVRRELKTFLKRNARERIVVLDIPLYLENKMNKKEDIIIFIQTKKRNRDIRLKKRKNFNLKLLKILRKSQLSLKQKKLKSNYVLDNNYNSVIIKNKVKMLKKKILYDRSSS